MFAPLIGDVRNTVCTVDASVGIGSRVDRFVKL